MAILILNHLYCVVLIIFNGNYMDEGQMPPGNVRTTADSEKEGRLIVSAGNTKTKKRKILKKLIKSK